MGYVNLGRKLGIGARVAAKMLRERTQRASSAAAAKAKAGATQTQARPHPGPKKRRVTQADPRAATRKAARGIARGSRGFGRGFWNPFKRAARALWHEVTGVFFAIFALFFGQSMWHIRGDWQSGPQHHRFDVYLVFTLVFAYFSIHAFVSSRRSPH